MSERLCGCGCGTPVSLSCAFGVGLAGFEPATFGPLDNGPSIHSIHSPRSGWSNRVPHPSFRSTTSITVIPVVVRLVVTRTFGLLRSVRSRCAPSHYQLTTSS